MPPYPGPVNPPAHELIPRQYPLWLIVCESTRNTRWLYFILFLQAELHASLASANPALAASSAHLWEKVIEVLESALFTDVLPPAELSQEERQAS